MRTSIIAGNWKMHHTLAETRAWAEAFEHDKHLAEALEVYVFPPFTHLTLAHELLAPAMHIGAQNLHQEAAGAYTGEVSGAMIAATGAEAVLVGHSERRLYFGEDNALLARKLKAALQSGLQPFYCVGETLAQREAGDAAAVVCRQLEEALSPLPPEELPRIVIAYEPVWAIGTGHTASPDDANTMHKAIRHFLADNFGKTLAEELRILYGGSVKGSNAAQLIALADVDGFLVGGASLQWPDFRAIIRACSSIG